MPITLEPEPPTEKAQFVHKVYWTCHRGEGKVASSSAIVKSGHLFGWKGVNAVSQQSSSLPLINHIRRQSPSTLNHSHPPEPLLHLHCTLDHTVSHLFLHCHLFALISVTYTFNFRLYTVIYSYIQASSSLVYNLVYNKIGHWIQPSFSSTSS